MRSDDDFGIEETQSGQGLAVAAEALFLLNLLIIPGLGFLILAALWLKHRDSAPPLAVQHLKQATYVSFWGGLLIVGLSALILATLGVHSEWSWVALILYFTGIHSTLVLLGMFALIKAMSGQIWRYPLIGPPAVHSSKQAKTK